MSESTTQPKYPSLEELPVNGNPEVPPTLSILEKGPEDDSYEAWQRWMKLKKKALAFKNPDVEEESMLGKEQEGGKMSRRIRRSKKRTMKSRNRRRNKRRTRSSRR